MNKRLLGCSLAALLALSGCVKPNEMAMKIGEAPQIEEGKSTVSFRALQSRRFDT